jgi:hypothetical protein
MEHPGLRIHHCRQSCLMEMPVVRAVVRAEYPLAVSVVPPGSGIGARSHNDFRANEFVYQWHNFAGDIVQYREYPAVCSEITQQRAPACRARAA